MFKVFALVTSSGICCSVRCVPKLGENLTCVSLHPRHSKTMWLCSRSMPQHWHRLFLLLGFQQSSLQLFAQAAGSQYHGSRLGCDDQRLESWHLRNLAVDDVGWSWRFSGWVKVDHDKSAQTLYHYYIGNRYWPFQYRKNDDKPWDCGGGAPCSDKTIQNQTDALLHGCGYLLEILVWLKIGKIGGSKVLQISRHSLSSIWSEHVIRVSVRHGSEMRMPPRQTKGCYLYIYCV